MSHILLSRDPIDLVELGELSGCQTDQFLAMMTPIFLEDSQKILSRLATAIQQADFWAIKQASHTLKGTSASMAMMQLAIHCREMETLTGAEDLSLIRQKFRQIKLEYGRVQAALANF